MTTASGTNSDSARDARSELIPCAHCSARTPRSLAVTPDQQTFFCCLGCQSVFNLLHRLRLSDFYAIRDRTGALTPQAKVQEKSYLEFDSSAVLPQLPVRSESGKSSKTIKLLIPTIHCAGCLWILEQLPRLESGVEGVEALLTTRAVHVQFDPERTRPSKIASTLNRLGYAPEPFTVDASERADVAEEHLLFSCLGVAALSWAAVMVLSESLVQGTFTGIDSDTRTVMHFVQLIITWPALLFAGRPFFRGVVATIVSGRPHMDLPIVIGLGSAFIFSAAATFSGGTRVYFDAVLELLLFLLMGRALQQRALLSARRAVRTSGALLPLTIRVQIGEDAGVPRFEVRPIQTLTQGDVLAVEPGSRFPADGQIISGKSTYSNATMTGEALPLSIVPGSEVCAGGLNIESEVVMKATSGARTSRLSRILKHVEESFEAKSSFAQFSEKLIFPFMVTVGIATIVTFLLHVSTGAWEALEHAVALLIVTCPCALGLAVPLAQASGIRQALGVGLITRRTDAFEKATQARKICFDKTGTLTLGLPTVRSGIQALAGSQVLAVARALANSGRQHPYSRAIAAWLTEKNPVAVQESVELREVTLVPGAGVQASRTVDGDVEVWKLGKPSFALAASEPESADSGESQVLLTRNGVTAIQFVLADLLNPQAPSAVASAQARGLTVYVLSGDAEVPVKRVAAEVGIELSNAHARMTPEEKRAFVEQLGEGSLMVGDGINDAAALATASLGIALKGDLAACLESSDVYVSSGNIADVETFLSGSVKVVSTMRGNVVFSLIYNLIAGGCAMAGLVTPLVAGILMPLSSLFVIVNSSRRTFFTART